MKNNCCNLKQSKISMNIFHHTVGPSNFISSGTANTTHLIKDKQRAGPSLMCFIGLDSELFRIRERERKHFYFWKSFSFKLLLILNRT